MNDLIIYQNKIGIEKLEKEVMACDDAVELNTIIIPKLCGFAELCERCGLMSLEDKNKIQAIKLKAELRLAEILRGLERGKTGPKKLLLLSPEESNSEFSSMLKEAGLNPIAAAKLQSAYDGVTEKDIDETLKEANKETAKLTKKKVVERMNKKRNNIKKEKKARKKSIADIEIRQGDFKIVLDDVKNIDAIITDPPYPKEFIQCFSDLSLYASTHLKDDGFLACYSGQYNLPEVIQRLSKHLIYVWTFCLYHVGKKQLVNGVNIMCGWKPVLIFSKGKKKMRFSAYDVLESKQMEKSSHKWQQSESGVEKLIEIFSEPGQLIVDPFAGAGTFLKVAKDLGRKAIGAEIQ